MGGTVCPLRWTGIYHHVALFSSKWSVPCRLVVEQYYGCHGSEPSVLYQDILRHDFGLKDHVIVAFFFILRKTQMALKVCGRWIF